MSKGTEKPAKPISSYQELLDHLRDDPDAELVANAAAPPTTPVVLLYTPELPIPRVEVAATPEQIVIELTDSVGVPPIGSQLPVAASPDKTDE